MFGPDEVIFGSAVGPAVELLGSMLVVSCPVVLMSGSAVVTVGLTVVLLGSTLVMSCPVVLMSGAAVVTDSAVVLPG